MQIDTKFYSVNQFLRPAEVSARIYEIMAFQWTGMQSVRLPRLGKEGNPSAALLITVCAFAHILKQKKSLRFQSEGLCRYFIQRSRLIASNIPYSKG